MTKLTKKVALEAAIVALSANEAQVYTMGETQFPVDEIKEKLVAMIEALDKKSTGEKKMTEQQKQNESFKVDIEVLLADGKARTATEILNEIPALKSNDVSNQRVSALLRQLKLAGKIKSETVKGKSLFSIAEGV